MATLLLTAVGTVLGGPIGGALGALAGRQVDSMLLGGRTVTGPRLKDLSVQTSSYGDALPLHFGTVRSAGTVIWSTELVEHEIDRGGGKGQPSLRTYSYSASFAVAIASRPIRSIGRIWADGNLLRGTAGDLKVGGAMRVHDGFGDQVPDPLLAQAEAAGHCPAYRDTAYVVFEDLQLADFGNRIPSLTFEIVADEGGCDVATICGAILPEATCTGLDQRFGGFSIDQGTTGDCLRTIAQAVPMASWLAQDALRLTAADAAPVLPMLLPPPAASEDAQNDKAKQGGWSHRREPLPRSRQGGLRYYDIARDYQPGLQRGKGRAEQGDFTIIELPAALAAADARALADKASRRLARPIETLSYRVTEIDPALFDQAMVRVPVAPGLWRIDAWEWQKDGVVLQLAAMPEAIVATAGAINDAGRHNAVADDLVTPTRLMAWELPWTGTGSGDTPVICVAASSTGIGWKGAALFARPDAVSGDLTPLGPCGRKRAVIGATVSALPPASPMVLDLASTVDVQLVADDLDLVGASLAQLLNGSNRAVIGAEIVQFGTAQPLGSGRWRLSRLFRGRGGTEWAIGGHGSGENFALLDGALVTLDSDKVANPATAQILAVGLGDTAAAVATIAGAGATLRPLSPVHGRALAMADGSIALSWVRRARGAWGWDDEVDAPLNEEHERWDVVLGDVASPVLRWTTDQASLIIDAAVLPPPADRPAAFHIRQIGKASLSPPLAIALPA